MTGTGTDTTATRYAEGDRVEWNPTGDVWRPATVVVTYASPVVRILLDDNGQDLNTSTTHLRHADAPVSSGASVRLRPREPAGWRHGFVVRDAHGDSYAWLCQRGDTCDWVLLTSAVADPSLIGVVTGDSVLERPLEVLRWPVEEWSPGACCRPDTPATVPDEAVRAGAADAYPKLDREGEIRDWACVICQRPIDDHDVERCAAVAEAESGWVLVPGPVRTEWGAAHEGQENTDNQHAVAHFRADECSARHYVEGRPASMRVVSRQVTEWRPASESTPDGAE